MSARASALRPLMRRATEADAAAVARLLSELGYACATADAAERIRTLSRERSQALIVADLHGELCGLVALDVMYYLPLGCNTCRITALVVGDGYRQFGVGRALLREAEQLARQHGAARIEVTTAGHRHEAHDFYRACGYAESSLRFVRRLGDA
jgi:N-acetylglutamate synthase-like GNAT family acetyltransferase